MISCFDWVTQTKQNEIINNNNNYNKNYNNTVNLIGLKENK